MLFYLELIQLAHLFFAYFFFFLLNKTNLFMPCTKCIFNLIKQKFRFSFHSIPVFVLSVICAKIVLPNKNDVCSFKEKLINHGYWVFIYVVPHLINMIPSVIFKHGLHWIACEISCHIHPTEKSIISVNTNNN